MPRFLPVFLLLTLLGARAACAQAYFNKRYTLNPDYSAGTTVVSVAGGYWISGVNAPPVGQNGQTLFLQRLTPDGLALVPVKQWSRPNYQYYTGVSNSLMTTADGGLALAGGTRSATNEALGHLWRFTAQGDTLWTRTYRAVAGEPGIIIRNGQQLPDGGFALIGEQYRLNPATSFNMANFLLIRTDALGRERWRQTYDVQTFELGLQLLATADGGFVLSGLSWENDGSWGPSNISGLVLKTDSAGQEQWRTLLSGPASNGAGPVLATPDGGYVVSGYIGQREQFGERYGRPALTWLDAGGQVVRQRQYGVSKLYIETYALHRLADGGYVFAGQQLDTANTIRGFVLRVCADGDSVWMRSYYKLAGLNSHNYLRDLRPTPDGGFVAAGFLHPSAPDPGPADTWVFKTDANGYLQAGGALPGVTCRPVGLPEAETDAGIEVWPNPNPAPDGRFTVRAAGSGPETRVTFAVLDARGRTVAAGELAGAETVVELTRQPAGLYLLRLAWPDGRTATRKLVR